MSAAVAHQRIIRDRLTEMEPREVPASLTGYSVETISRSDAVPIIARYEWLGRMGPNTLHTVGLLSPARELHGVACFGYGPTGQIRTLIGEPALCLERGACVHYAPRNAASYLINTACKLIYRATGTSTFFAYADEMAGEYGGVYQAAGWAYLGQGLHGVDASGMPRQRQLRVFVLPPGKDPDDPANWQTTRMLRRQKPRLHMSDCEQHGWRIAKRPGKHVYATDVGRYRKRWRKTITSLPYPALNPELKIHKHGGMLAVMATSSPVFRLTKPPPHPQFELFDEIVSN